MNITPSTFIAIVLGVLLVIALLLLYKKRMIDGEVLSGTAEMIQQIPIPEGNSIFSLILKYCATAVLTVEQMVKVGKVNKDDTSRKQAAMDIVKTAAKVDNIPFGEEEEKIADAGIEAEVNQLPRNQPPSN